MEKVNNTSLEKHRLFSSDFECLQVQPLKEYFLMIVSELPGSQQGPGQIGDLRVPILKRVVEAIRQAVGTDVEIEIRADSGFATPRLYEFCECEENKLQYVIGLSRNPRLQRVVEPLLDSICSSAPSSSVCSLWLGRLTENFIKALPGRAAG